MVFSKCCDTAFIKLLSVISIPENSPFNRPSDIVSILWLTPSTSGISEEITITASPCSARPAIRAWIADFEPTSIPRVGSSRINKSGSLHNHFGRNLNLKKNKSLLQAIL